MARWAASASFPLQRHTLIKAYIRTAFERGMGELCGQSASNLGDVLVVAEDVGRGLGPHRGQGGVGLHSATGPAGKL